jgi:hypothetical protein
MNDRNAKFKIGVASTASTLYEFQPNGTAAVNNLRTSRLSAMRVLSMGNVVLAIAFNSASDSKGPFFVSPRTLAAIGASGRVI